MAALGSESEWMPDGTVRSGLSQGVVTEIIRERAEALTEVERLREALRTIDKVLRLSGSRPGDTERAADHRASEQTRVSGVGDCRAQRWTIRKERDGVGFSEVVGPNTGRVVVAPVDETDSLRQQLEGAAEALRECRNALIERQVAGERWRSAVADATRILDLFGGR